MQQQQLNFDLSKTTPIEPPSGGKIWLSGVVLRKVSKFVQVLVKMELYQFQYFLILKLNKY